MVYVIIFITFVKTKIMNTYTCTKCQKTRVEDFFKLGSRIKSRNNRSAVCKECDYGFIPIHLRTHKVCKKCEEKKEIGEFQFTDKKRGYTHSYCRKCKNKIRQVKREIEGGEYLRYKNGRGKNRVQDAKACKFKKHKITKEDYNIMFESQNYECVICRKDLKNLDSKHSPHIDHCHITGKVRGILCHKCNPGLGMFEDNIEYLKSAIEYLENFITL